MLQARGWLRELPFAHKLLEAEAEFVSRCRSEFREDAAAQASSSSAAASVADTLARAFLHLSLLQNK